MTTPTHVRYRDPLVRFIRARRAEHADAKTARVRKQHGLPKGGRT